MRRKKPQSPLARLREERADVQRRLDILQARAKELDEQIEQQENVEIVGAVRAKGLSLEAFAALLNQLAQNPLPPVDRTPEATEFQTPEANLFIEGGINQ